MTSIFWLSSFTHNVI